MSTRIHRGSWIVTLPLAAAAVAYVVLVYLPGRRATSGLREQVAEQRDRVARAAGLGLTLTTTQRQLEKTRQYNTTWRQRAPREGERAAFDGKIHELAKAAGTRITRFEPKPILPRAAVREIPLAMGCTGTFLQVYEFIRSLESMPLAIWVDSVVIKRTSENSESVLCEINLVIFSDNPESSG